MMLIYLWLCKKKIGYKIMKNILILAHGITGLACLIKKLLALGKAKKNKNKKMITKKFNNSNNNNNNNNNKKRIVKKKMMTLTYLVLNQMMKKRKNINKNV